MITNKATQMKLERSPDAIPPLMQATPDSPNEDEFERVLREPPRRDRMSMEGIRRALWDEHESSALSEATILALPPYSNAGLPIIDDRDTFLKSDGQCPEGPNEENIDVEDVPIEPSCHGGLNLSPQQLADIFALFHNSQRHWPQSAPSEVSDGAVTTVTSNTGPPGENLGRIVESLERECNTLKEIIHHDSATIFRLKSDLESCRDRFCARESEILRLRAELDDTQRTRDLLQEVDAQHCETIDVLKKELDNLSQCLGKLSPSQKEELEQLRLENALFASQIVENETEMIQMQAIVQNLGAENSALSEELKLLRDRLDDASKHSEATEALGRTLSAQISHLADRLKEMERGSNETFTFICEERIRWDKEIEGIKQILSRPNNEFCKSLIEQVEVQHVDGGVRKVALIHDSDTSRTPEILKAEDHKCTNPTSVSGWFCDCFPSPSIAKH